MSNDNVLRKEFSKKDVERARNLIKGDTNARTSQGVGYTKKSEHHKEGDIWNEDGRKWTIKKGIKQNITKLDSAKKAHVMPLLCPECNRIMNHSNHKAFYQIHKKCHDCVIEFEHRLDLRGELEEYKEKLKAKNFLSIVNEKEAYLLDAINTSNSNFVSEDGVVERWVGGINKKELTQQVKEAAKISRKRIKKSLND